MTINVRAVVLSRPSEYELLLHRHGTLGQARFHLESRGQSIDSVIRRHRKLEEAMKHVSATIPSEWRRANVQRSDLDRFLFEPEDIVIAVGQDGLVANASKYISGVPVLGVNPNPDEYEGVLVAHAPSQCERLFQAFATGRMPTEERTMVEALVDGRQSLVALNEVFVGHKTHQSARYRIEVGDKTERQSSSGVIVATGTGASGWARSIVRQRAKPQEMPEACDPWLGFFVREAFPSVSTGTGIAQGVIDQSTPLILHSEMDDDGVIFGDGIEADRIRFGWGSRVVIQPAQCRLQLLTTQ